MPRESVYHKQGKQLARLELLKRGFKRDEIYFEYSFRIDSNYRPGWTTILVDVVGIKEDIMIAYEIGHFDKLGREEAINDFFDEVNYWDYKFLSKKFFVPKTFQNNWQYIKMEDSE